MTMKDSEFIIRARRKWVELYGQTKNATLVCHRCGISATTLRKWRRPYEADGKPVYYPKVSIHIIRQMPN